MCVCVLELLYIVCAHINMTRIETQMVEMSVINNPR